MLQAQQGPASVSERDEAAPTWATGLLWNLAHGLSLSKNCSGHFVRWNWVCLRWSSHCWDFFRLLFDFWTPLPWRQQYNPVNWCLNLPAMGWTKSIRYNLTREITFSTLLLLLIFFSMTRLIRVYISIQTRRAQSSIICLFQHDTLYAVLLKNEILLKTNKTSVNSMATGVGLACDL